MGLVNALRYDRAVGYFTSSVFSTAADAFECFFLENDGRMRLVCSPALDASDIQALTRAIFDRRQALGPDEALRECLKKGQTADALAMLVARGLVDVRIAIATSGSQSSLYHEKIGILRDDRSDLVAFSGSANETRSAWVGNFERVDVFTTWGAPPDRGRAFRIDGNFRELWRGETNGVRVVGIVDALRDGLLVANMASHPEDAVRPSARATPAIAPEALRIPPDLSLMDHQKEAIRQWAASAGRGVFKMATGSGKTITALALAAKLSVQMRDGLGVLLVAPLIHLVDQWCDVAAGFGLRPIRCAEGQRRWRDELSTAVNALNAGKRPILSIAVTQVTLGSPEFQELVDRIAKPLLVIGDEVHNYGHLAERAMLPELARYRVGLSATPWPRGRPLTVARLQAYFGPVVYKYGLREAIEHDVLTPYRYYPIRVAFDDDEFEAYLDLSKQLARYAQDDPESSENEVVMRLLLKRARLIASARQKIPLLREQLEGRRRDTHILVYCGDGRVEDKADPGEVIRQVHAAVQMIGNDLGMACASYTAETPPEKRKQIRDMFSAGDLQVLVAIRCLDEGVDIPAARSAYILASSTNPRQFIQRRGRVLRKAPGKTRADVYDFITVPDLEGMGAESGEYKVARRLLANEFHRAAEFADLAMNGPVARATLLDLTSRLGLFTEWHVTEKEED